MKTTIAAALLAVSLFMASPVQAGDAEMDAYSRAAEKILTDLARTDRHGAADARARLDQALGECGDDACVRQAYLDEFVELFGNHDIHLRGGDRFERTAILMEQGRATSNSWGELSTFDLGEGWRLVVVSASWAPEEAYPDFICEWGPSASAHSGQVTGVVRLADDPSAFRDGDGNGFDLAREDTRTWRVDQVGECTCGVHVTIAGWYRRAPR